MERLGLKKKNILNTGLNRYATKTKYRKINLIDADKKKSIKKNLKLQELNISTHLSTMPLLV